MRQKYAVNALQTDRYPLVPRVVPSRFLCSTDTRFESQSSYRLPCRDFRGSLLSPCKFRDFVISVDHRRLLPNPYLFTTHVHPPITSAGDNATCLTELPETTT